MTAAELLKRVLARPGGGFSLLVVGVLILLALTAPWLPLPQPNSIAPMLRFQDPSAQHWLGTDQLGRDLLSRSIYGARIALGIAASVIALSLTIGVTLGILAALSPKVIDQALQALFDVVRSFPTLILALALVAVFGPGLGNIVLLISVVFIPMFGRVARAQTIALRNSPFLEAEKVLGAQRWRVLLHHVVPNIIGPIFVLASMNIPVVITIEAGMSFLGLGVKPPLASWGSLLNDGYTYLDQSAWPTLVSGGALILATLGFSLLGEALRDAIDPKLRVER
jgi:peptide/nickel transport system permease protein